MVKIDPEFAFCAQCAHWKERIIMDDGRSMCDIKNIVIYADTDASPCAREGIMLK